MARMELSRRAMLGGLAGVAGAAALAACQPSGGSGGTGGTGGSGRAASGSFTPPAYVPFEGITPDLPGTEDGVSPGFLSFPNPVIARDGFPLPDTEPVTALMQNAPPHIAPEKNPAYEAFRRDAGNAMNATTIISTEYKDKYTVTIAGNEIPDFMMMEVVPQFPSLLEKYFTDLTDVLGGDGVKAYPALANIPTPTWQIPTINGRLWGISQPRPPAGRILSTRGDLLEAKGLPANPEPADGAEFVELLAALTDKGQNQFALGADPVGWVLRGVLEMMGAPNVWAMDGDTFVSQIASEQMKDALNETGKIVQAGYLHPNSFSDPGQNGAWWTAGTTAMMFQGFTGWGTFARQHPDWKVGYVRLPTWDGSAKASIYRSQAGYYSFVGIKKQSSDKRLEELLKLADLIASPFGTQQFLDVNYGAEGVTYEMKDGNPEFLENASDNTIKGWPYLGGNAQAVLFAPGQDDLIRAQHTYLSEVMTEGVDDASNGLYSETSVTKGATYGSKMKDVQRAVMLGEKPMSEWESFVATWQSDVGDAMAAEYAEAKANS
ncbi:hypothetical protein [Microlunatus sp. Y2014]|uniref:hypothetical protein n=1 Tax=Microlunatus sp. Y2014 TaxID=3418488 RepID=UPI003DA77270